MLLDKPDDNNEDSKRPSLPQEFIQPVDLLGLGLEKQFAQRQFEFKAVSMNKEGALVAAKELYDELQEIKQGIPSMSEERLETNLSKEFYRKDYFQIFDRMTREDLITCAKHLHSQVIMTRHLMGIMGRNEFTNGY